MKKKAKCLVCGEGNLTLVVHKDELVGTTKNDEQIFADQIYLSCTFCKGEYNNKESLSLNNFLRNEALSN